MMGAQFKQSALLLAANVLLLSMRSPILRLSPDLYRTLALLSALWIIVGPAIMVLRERRLNGNRASNLIAIARELLAGIAMNVMAVFIIFLLFSGLHGNQEAGP